MLEVFIVAKLTKKYKGYYIKETTSRDNTLYNFWVCLPYDYSFVDWECSSIQEAEEFIDGKILDKINKQNNFSKEMKKIGEYYGLR